MATHKNFVPPINVGVASSAVQAFAEYLPSPCSSHRRKPIRTLITRTTSNQLDRFRFFRELIPIRSSHAPVSWASLLAVAGEHKTSAFGRPISTARRKVEFCTGYKNSLLALGTQASLAYLEQNTPYPFCW